MLRGAINLALKTSKDSFVLSSLHLYIILKVCKETNVVFITIQSLSISNLPNKTFITEKSTIAVKPQLLLEMEH